MKVEIDADNGDIIITLKTHEEKHTMWHALNLSGERIVRNSTRHAHLDTINKAGFAMWKSYSKVAEKYERAPAKLNKLFLVSENGQTYLCPLCRNTKPLTPCSMCGGLGKVQIMFAENTGE